VCGGGVGGGASHSQHPEAPMEHYFFQWVIILDRLVDGRLLLYKGKKSEVKLSQARCAYA
jgi:hypothetical protein